MSGYGRSRAHEAAIDAAEAVRQLNHLTYAARWASEPADVYDVLGALREMASRLPQSVQQLGFYLADAQARGVLRRAGGDASHESVQAAIGEFNAAVAAAAALSGALGTAQRLVGDLYEEAGDGD